ncbi:hypothetical protein [Bacillus canaveralius]|uniref:hypothetical protein n=1 Tax=Bacillus canaveralius TaxID=1403243 RepID=UPI0015E0E2D6|nr:hypothetical protein [Bacillus canaveralius]
MKIKTLSRKRIIELEKAVENGVYVTPAEISEKQDLLTKKLIEQMKNSKQQIANKR